MMETLKKNPSWKYILTIALMVLFITVKDVLVPLVREVTSPSSKQSELLLEKRLTTVETLMKQLEGVPTQLTGIAVRLQTVEETTKEMAKDLKDHVLDGKTRPGSREP